MIGRFIVTFILILFCVPSWAAVRVTGSYLGIVTANSTFTIFRGYDRRVVVHTIQEDDVQAVVFCYIGLIHGTTSVKPSSFSLFRHTIFFRPGYLPITIPDTAFSGSRFVGATSGSYYYNYFNYSFDVSFPSESSWVVDPSYELPESPVVDNVYTEDDLRICSMIFGALLFIPFSRFMRS